MKILLSAFACSHHTGSEGGVGWRWAIELSKLGHDVVVLTDESRRQAIEEKLQNEAIPRLTFVCYRPSWLAWVTLNSKTAQVLFSCWQYSLLPKARSLHAEHSFDLAIHLTYGVFRHPSFLGFLAIPFIFGPVGGGEDAPYALKAKLPFRERVKELLRTGLNSISRFNPMLHVALRRATLILAKTGDTRAALPASFRSRVEILQEIGIDVEPKQHAGPQVGGRDPSAPLELLFAGRLLGLKGIHLAIPAVAQAAKRGHNVKLTIVGNGPLGEWLKALARQEAVEDKVTWIAHLPQPQLFALYGRMHGLLFPSLHDSSGNVVLEAMSFGLPVVCLSVGGPATLVDGECARVVAVDGVAQDEVVGRLADALGDLASDEPLRQAMAAAAIRRAASMTWASRPQAALALLDGRLAR